MTDFEGSFWFTDDPEDRDRCVLQLYETQIRLVVGGRHVGDWNRSNATLTRAPIGYNLTTGGEAITFVPDDPDRFEQALSRERKPPATGSSNGPARSVPDPQARKKKDKKIARWTIIATVAVLGLAALGTALGDSDRLDSADMPEDWAVWSVCKEFMEDRLKAPATADFAPTREVDIAPMTGTANGYEAVGYVDAENGFGALIRTEFVCWVEHLGNNQFRLIELAEL